MDEGMNTNSVVVDSGEAKFVLNFLQDIHAAINADLNNPNAQMTEAQMKYMRDYRFAVHRVMQMIKGNRGSYKDIKREELNDFLLMVMTENGDFFVESEKSNLEDDIDKFLDMGYVVTAFRVVPDTGNKVIVYEGLPTK